MDDWRLKVRFWGVRGSVPTPVARNMGYGGNTTCVEITLPHGETLILDAGTGITELGTTIPTVDPLHLIFTHLHWDHLQGLPYFAPLFAPGVSMKLYSSRYCDDLKDALQSLMRGPYFPVDFRHAGSDREFIEFGREPIEIGGASIKPFQVNHPNGAAAYRIEAGGATVIFCPDRECGDRTLDKLFLENVQGADLLIHDAQYTPAEIVDKRGWGHSTWAEAAQTAERAGVKHLGLFHHDPGHDDDFMAQMEADAANLFPRTFAAREGLVIKL